MTPQKIFGILSYMHVIAQYRARHNLTIGAFSQLAGVTYEAVRRWEKGDLQPGPQVAIKIEAETKGGIMRHELRPDLWSEGMSQIATRAAL